MGSQDQKVMIEQIKADKIASELGYFKAQIVTIEKKVDEEVAFRVRNEDEIRKWFEQKFALMMERLNFEERSQLDRERRIMQSL
jgi:hypothetical protein